MQATSLPLPLSPIHEDNAVYAEVQTNFSTLPRARTSLSLPLPAPPLQVLPGSSRIFMHDDSLSTAANNPKDLANVNKLGCFTRLCRLLEEAYHLDYIIVDLSPGASALNKIIVTRWEAGAAWRQAGGAGSTQAGTAVHVLRMQACAQGLCMCDAWMPQA